MKARLPQGYGKPDVNALMRQAQKMQESVQEKQAELEAAEYQGSAGGGLVELTMTGTVEHLDGIEFTAEVRPDGSSATLAPSQSMTLKKIRITVGGTYTKKF